MLDRIIPITESLSLSLSLWVCVLCLTQAHTRTTLPFLTIYRRILCFFVAWVRVLWKMSSITTKVDKATSELLMTPDWTMNMESCDAVNSDLLLAKDVTKALKKRLQHKNHAVQLLSLTLLETLIKNCGDYLHLQVVERNILQEMIKIVKRKSNMQVRDKILVLLGSWQAAFGGPQGKYPQYFWAYDELRQSGVEFPPISKDEVPIFIPPVTQPTARRPEVSIGMPAPSSRSLDETMALERDLLSLSDFDAIQNIVDLLKDMLDAINPKDPEATKNEVIVDLTNQCQSHQKKLMQLVNSTTYECSCFNDTLLPCEIFYNTMDMPTKK